MPLSAGDVPKQYTSEKVFWTNVEWKRMLMYNQGLYLFAIHAWLRPYVCFHLAICIEGGSSPWGAPGLLPGFGLLLDPDVAFILQPAVTWPLVGGACACHPLQPVYLFCHLQYPSALTDNTINNWNEFWNECVFTTLYRVFILLSLTLCLLSVCSP